MPSQSSNKMNELDSSESATKMADIMKGPRDEPSGLPSATAAALLPHSLETKLEEVKQMILYQVDKSLSSTIDKLTADLSEESFAATEETATPATTYRNAKNGIPALKVFVKRNSVLTTLLRSSTHIQAMYNMCLTFFTFLILNVIARYIHTPAEFFEDFEFFTWALGKFSYWVFVWIAMFLSIVTIVYPIFHWWSFKRITFRNKRLLDGICAALFVIYLGTFIYFPVVISIKYDFPPATTFALLMEQTRMLMKTYAFVRHNVPRAMAFKVHQDGDSQEESPCPDIGKLMYFLFAPTLVYRDEYPRTRTINWKYVAWNFLQVLLCIFPGFVALKRFVIGEFRNIGNEAIAIDVMLSILFNATFIGTMALFLNFYALLHCWMNAFAEMLRFGDRMFYEDWWNCKSFSKYYRSWNVVVHDWLYSYVYRDAYLLTRNKVLGMLITFFISALFHEYIIGFTFRFFYPVMFVFFEGVGVSMVFLTRRLNNSAGNVWLFFSLFLGWGLLIVLYSLEWYARINCPPLKNHFWDVITPRSWTCRILATPASHS